MKGEKEFQGEMLRLMFKYGDDLRQDNLVLQFFRLMDKLWLANDLDLDMIAYNVLETGFMVGFIEFVDNACEVASIHKGVHLLRGPFDEKSIFNYFSQELRKRPQVESEELLKFHESYQRSLAGQCVATYVLGIKDRHTGNFMF